MAKVRPFKAYRPRTDLAAQVASPPYDVLSSEEARAFAAGKPYSFLHIGKSEIDLAPGVDPHSRAVYAKARENLERFVAEGILVRDPEESLYLYSQATETRRQTGLLFLADLSEYESGKIRRHELTRLDKETDRADHISATGSHSGPALLAYRGFTEIDARVERICRGRPETDFMAEDGIRHSLWPVISRGEIDALVSAYAKIPVLYIADGHHRTAAALRVRNRLKEVTPDLSTEHPANFFLAVAFPDSQLKILDYNRVVRDLNGLTEEEFLGRLAEKFVVRPRGKGESPRPAGPKAWGMRLGGKWFELEAKKGSWDESDRIGSLDLSVLQENLLLPILGIRDQRTDSRIDFVGGARGYAELERRCDSDMKVAFLCYPPSLGELESIADEGKIMPPKSTWFEPKLRDGIALDIMW